MLRKTAFIGLLASAVAVALPASLRAQDGVTPTSIKIGMYGPLTGPASLWGYPTQAGAMMIYKEVNDKGGIHGRKIEVVQEDGACDAAKTIAAVKKLIHREKVFMINSGICSGPTLAAKEEIVSNKVPLMLFAASLDAITAPANPYVYTVAPTGSFDGKSMAEFAKSIPNTKKVALTEATSFAGDMEMDSLTVMDLVASMEDEWDIMIPLNLLPDLETIGQVADAVAGLVAKKG